jgi:hypothetical protein
VLHPNQFNVNEAWIAFWLNDAPIRTEQDGSFNVIALMDAVSCLILATTFVPIDKSEPSKLETRHLFKTAREHKRALPTTLFVPAGEFQRIVAAEADRQGLSVVPVHEGQLLAFIGEARESFRDHFAGRNSEQ